MIFLQAHKVLTCKYPDLIKMVKEFSEAEKNIRKIIADSEFFIFEGEKYTADLVILSPLSGSDKTSGFPRSSSSAMAEKVVPKSIPTILLISSFVFH